MANNYSTGLSNMSVGLVIYSYIWILARLHRMQVHAFYEREAMDKAGYHFSVSRHMCESKSLALPLHTGVVVRSLLPARLIFMSKTFHVRIYM